MRLILGCCIYLIKQAAVDGRIKVWGRKDHDGLLFDIDPEYWKEHEVHILDYQNNDNKNTGTYSNQLKPSLNQDYTDIHLEREAAKVWLKEVTKLLKKQ